MKTTKEKLLRSSELLEILVKQTNRNNIPCQRYYKVLYIYQNLRKLYNYELNLNSAISHLDKLTNDQRLYVFSNYCKFCGSKDDKCYCMNDD